MVAADQSSPQPDMVPGMDSIAPVSQQDSGELLHLRRSVRLPSSFQLRRTSERRVSHPPGLTAPVTYARIDSGTFVCSGTRILSPAATDQLRGRIEFLGTQLNALASKARD